MPEATMKKLHLPLSSDMHARLKREAEALGTPTTVLAREAVTEWLARRDRERIADELHAFAREHAGTELDLDASFEVAATDALTRTDG